MEWQQQTTLIESLYNAGSIVICDVTARVYLSTILHIF